MPAGKHCPISLPLIESLCRKPHRLPDEFNVSVETDNSAPFNAMRSVSYPSHLGWLEDGLRPGPTLRPQSSSYPNSSVATHGQPSDGGEEVGEEPLEWRWGMARGEEEEVRSTGRGTFVSNLKNAFVNRQFRLRPPPPPPPPCNIPVKPDPNVQFAESTGMGISYMKVSMTQVPKDGPQFDLDNMDGVGAEEEKEGEEEEEQEEEEREVDGEGDGFRSLLLFVPLRLGQDKFNPEYADALKVV